MIKRDKDWRAYPIGTKAHAYNGGAWLRTDRGWQWNGGGTFPTPGADAIGYCIELPENASVKIPANPAESQPPAGGFFVLVRSANARASKSLQRQRQRRSG